eukprot:TRINITY_DN5889_c0_g1_i2.p1 TRINITY_DN5889_c0_g1~~TRINITY_DN5889_c0_g1_i2.p1  ORF type:complete len:1017 (-),score=172.30 TRINITY_DN5889_c0_g1_i2:111-3161(-)
MNPRLESIRREIVVFVGTVIARLVQDLKHSKREISVRKTSYCLGFLSCFLVVFIVSLTGTVLLNAPVVFLKIAEGQGGEIDFTIKPKYPAVQSIDHTIASSVLSSSSKDTTSPRFVYTTQSYRLETCDRSCFQGSLYSCEGGYTNELCLEECCIDKEETTLYAIDTTRESTIGVGRNWDYSPLEPDEAYMHEELASKLGLAERNFFYIRIYIDQLSMPLWKDMLEIAGLENDPENGYSYVVLRLFVKELYSDPKGKHSQNTKNSIIVEYNSLLRAFQANFNPSAPESLLKSLNQLTPYRYAQQLVLNHPDRITAYKSSVYQTVQDNIISFGSKALYQLGFPNLEVDAELLADIQLLQFFSLFLGLLINLIVFILCILSVMLIYSLMMVSVETRTFEMGIMRMIGMTKLGVIEIIVVHALVYAIPSWIVGLLFGLLINTAIASVFKSFTGIPVPNALEAGPVGIATFLGLFIPLAASILPMQSALAISLHDSIDVRRSKTQAVKFSIERADHKRISWSMIAIGSGLGIFGFIIYYLFPLALISLNIQLLLNIFFGILLAMLAGLVILSLNFQYIMEKIAIHLTLFFEKAAIKSIVEKNLIAHRLRNRKTSIMYSLSLGFIIFIAVAFNVQIDSFKYSVRRENGVFLKVSTSTGMRSGLLQELENYVDNEPLVKGWTWMSNRLDELVGVDDVQIENLGHVYNFPQLLHGIAPNFFQPQFKEFLLISERSASDYEIDEELYTADGSSRVLIGSLYKEEVGIESRSQDFLLRFEGSVQPKVSRLRASAFMDLAPTLKFSKFPAVREQNAAVSFPSFVRFSRGRIPSVDNVTMSSLSLEIADDLPSSSRKAIKRNITNIFKRFPNVESPDINDYYEIISALDIASEIMNYFFLFTTLISMCICFFSLTSSMYANVLEQSKEIGVMLSIGVRKDWIYRVYIYEAFILVLSSSSLGIVIGAVIGFTMTLQRQLFTQLPIAFSFPTDLLIAIVVASVLLAVLASFHPTRRMTQKSIVEILRTME